MTVEERLKAQLGEMLWNLVMASDQIEKRDAEIMALKKQIEDAKPKAESD